MMSPIAVITV